MLNIKNWVPDCNDFALGECLMISEDYSRTARTYSEKSYLYGALLYSILSLREKFKPHKEKFNQFLTNDLLTAESILRNESKVKEILKKWNSTDQRINAVISSAQNWNKLRISERIREDERYETGFKIREDMVREMFGVGYKSASFFLRMGGYENLVPVDIWAMKYIESRGFIDRRQMSSGLDRKRYLEYEKRLTKYSKKFNVSPALFQATIYARFSTWKKDAKITPEYY